MKNIAENLQRFHFLGCLLIKKCVDSDTITKVQEERWSIEVRSVRIKRILYEEIYESTGVKFIPRNPHGISLGDLSDEA